MTHPTTLTSQNSGREVTASHCVGIGVGLGSGVGLGLVVGVGVCVDAGVKVGVSFMVLTLSS